MRREGPVLTPSEHAARSRLSLKRPSRVIELAGGRSKGGTHKIISHSAVEASTRSPTACSTNRMIRAVMFHLLHAAFIWTYLQLTPYRCPRISCQSVFSSSRRTARPAGAQIPAFLITRAAWYTASALRMPLLDDVRCNDVTILPKSWKSLNDLIAAKRCDRCPGAAGGWLAPQWREERRRAASRAPPLVGAHRGQGRHRPADATSSNAKSHIEVVEPGGVPDFLNSLRGYGQSGRFLGPSGLVHRKAISRSS